MPTVLLLGGYGAFGGRIAERLVRDAGLHLVIAGRSGERAAAFAAALSRTYPDAHLAAASLDAAAIAPARLRSLAADVVINASGPYQRQDYALARACIDAGAHYIDLADARDFVVGIAALDRQAADAGVLVTSGASTVPAIAGAAIEALAPQFAALRSIAITISPGNAFDPGLATVRSILGALGQPIRRGGEPSPAMHGWQPLHRRSIPGLGGRWAGACETPDLDLLPQRYPGLQDVAVHAALEVGAFHLGLWGLSWLVRAGLLRRPEALAAPLLRLKGALGFLGSDAGGMLVELDGTDRGGAPLRRQWCLVARSGHGPFIPGTPAVILTRQLLAGRLQQRGALPCLGLLRIEDVLSELADLDIAAGPA